jgi:hypothetical protein
MTDWERVDSLRAKGMDWDDIAEDDKVGFKPPEGSGRPGLALKSLYFQRRSRQKRVGPSANGKGGTPVDTEKKRRRRRNRNIALVGILLALAGAVPYGLSFVVSLVGALGVSLYLAVVAIIGVALLGFAIVAGGTRSLARWKTGAIGGVVVGLLVSGSLVGVSVIAGCPSLDTSPASSPGGWEFASSNSIWMQNGAPVMFFLGSAACPYCSASSWALYGAIANFTTTHTGEFWATSNPNDVYPNTPEVDMAQGFTSSGGAISAEIYEGSDRNAISVPSVGCPMEAYVNTYDSTGSIPFVVVGGMFIHTTTVVDPSELESGGIAETPQQLETDLIGGCNFSTNTPADACAVLNAQYWLEAYMWQADVIAHVQVPSAVSTNAQVITDWNAIASDQ